MTNNDPRRRRPLQGKVDFTFMYAAHDAFNRDLWRLAVATEAGRTADAAVRTGWATFKNQLHIHHTAEDAWLWPALRKKGRRLAGAGPGGRAGRCRRRVGSWASSTRASTRYSGSRSRADRHPPRGRAAVPSGRL